MKPFYSTSMGAGLADAAPLPDAPRISRSPSSHIRTRARVAVYEGIGAAPRVEEVETGPLAEYVEALSARVYDLAKGLGGTIPYTAIREVSENFIHADFAEPVVTILDSGMTIRFADQGPGIRDKDKALLPGFTTASGEMKLFIRGVGSGLPIVRDYLSYSGGSLVIEDNLGSGAVVTLHARLAPAQGSEDRSRARFADFPGHPADTVEVMGVNESRLGDSVARPSLSTRQKQVLALVMESGSAGPSLVAKELGVGVSTAYRDLASLEEFGLIASDNGKRTLTEHGLICIDDLIAR